MRSDEPGGGMASALGAADQELRIPHPVRIYDYLLGGKDNYGVDRAAAESMVGMLPNVREAARANRSFMVRAVRLMAEEGIRQFLDLGTGLPTSPNVHEVARGVVPTARVAYVDNEPIVTVFNRALRARVPGIVAVQQDLRDPDAVLADAGVRQVLDLAEPVGLLLVAVLHFVDPQVAARAVERYVRSLAPGSMVAISAACADDLDAPDVARIRAVYAASPSPFVFHDPTRFAALFDGLELCEPGIVEVSQWRDAGAPLTYSGMSFLAGIARKR
jgi:O-methyltransferase involved in polyketide biosynthesis